MAGVGGVQIIRGKTYRMYTPQWYEAMDADKVAEAANKGEAAGTQASTAISTLRSAVPDLFPTGGSSASSSSGSGGGGSRVSMPSVGMPGGGVPSGYMGSLTPGPSGPAAGAPRLSPVDTSEADAAQFARAKDTIGDVTRGSIVGLRSALASRGQLGGGGEFRGTGRIIEKGAGKLGDVARDKAIENVSNERSRALAQFTGDISMRGQDLSAQQAASALAARLAEVQYQGEITQRGQDLAAEQNRFSQSQSQQQQQMLILDRILNALNPIY